MTKNYEDYLISGHEKLKKHDYDGAIADFDEVIKLKPDLAVAYYRRGLAKMRKSPNSYLDPYADLSRAIDLEPNNYIYHQAMGEACYYMGYRDSALGSFVKMCALKRKEEEKS